MGESWEIEAEGEECRRERDSQGEEWRKKVASKEC